MRNERILLTSFLGQRSPMAFTICLNIANEQFIFSSSPWTSKQAHFRATWGSSHFYSTGISSMYILRPSKGSEPCSLYSKAWYKIVLPFWVYKCAMLLIFILLLGYMATNEENLWRALNKILTSLYFWSFIEVDSSAKIWSSG